jgi:hypothetical protein
MTGHFPFSRIREIQKFSLRRRANHWHWSAYPGPPEGRIMIVTIRWAGMRWTLWRQAVLPPDEIAAAYGKVVWSWRRDRGVYPRRPVLAWQR